MTIAEKKWTRRNFLKTAGAAGVGSVLTSLGEKPGALAAEDMKQSTVPQRPFGKSGINVSILSLGGMFNTSSNQLLLKQAVNWGVTYWDTADCYGWSGSEKGIGKYFSRFPEDRQKIFLVTKSDDRDPEGMSRLLARSLERMNTDFVDLYFIHGISGIDELNNRTRAWAEKAKADGKIRLFGFSTHGNMEECLLDAAKLGWIDGIMMTYNYRLMHSPEMKRAVDSCINAGIGLTAMKTQGGGSVYTSSEAELKLAGRFVQKGFTDAQAKLMAVWENRQISSICSQMPNLALLSANTAAALNRTSLSASDRKFLRQHANATASAYCTGCSKICETALGGRAPVGDVMRYLMYSRSYGDRDYAAGRFNEIPQKTRKKMPGLDYSLAEARCPRKVPIGKLMREATEEFA
ncbi:MAG: aldo/keto reductase [Desulfobacterales bacterium]|nr:aldo/keto reductase [Desulfobacterales bacterium]